MDTTIRNLDENAYRELKAKAALEGKSIGEAVSEAIRRYIGRSSELSRDRSLADLIPTDFGAGSEHLSRRVDQTVYGR